VDVDNYVLYTTPVVSLIRFFFSAFMFLLVFSFYNLKESCMFASIDILVCPLDVCLLTIFMRAILQYVMIVLKGSVPISFGGTEEPAAYGELVSIGGLSSDVNKKLSSAISTILLSKLSVPKSRFFLKFYDVQASHLNI